MGINTSEPPQEQIRNFLIVVLGAMATAGLIVFLLVHYYGASGKYTAGHVLLAPHVAETMAYNTYDAKTNDQNARFVFDNAQFTYPEEGKQKTATLSLPEYEKLYDLVARDTSLLEPSNEITSLFDAHPTANLTILVRTNSPAKWQAETLVFQKMQILTNDKFYRILLHEENSGDNWVYFTHKHLYQELRATLVNP